MGAQVQIGAGVNPYLPLLFLGIDSQARGSYCGRNPVQTVLAWGIKAHHRCEIGLIVPLAWFDAEGNSSTSSLKIVDTFFPCSIGRPTKLLLFKYLPWTVVPVTWRGDVKVVSTASWLPPHMANPFWLLPMRNSPPPWRGC